MADQNMPKEAIEYETDLNTLLNAKNAPSKSKIQSLQERAIHLLRHYKSVVFVIERFVSRAPGEQKIAGLYIMNDICLYAHAKLTGEKRDLYPQRFARSLPDTVGHIYRHSSNDNQARVRRIVTGWMHRKIFDDATLQKLKEFESTPEQLAKDKVAKEAKPPASSSSPSKTKRSAPSDTHPQTKKRLKGESASREHRQSTPPVGFGSPHLANARSPSVPPSLADADRPSVPAHPNASSAHKPSNGKAATQHDHNHGDDSDDDDDDDDDFGISHVGGSKLQSLLGQLSEKTEA